MANSNYKFYTNKEMAMICNVSEPSMTNLAKRLKLAPVKTGEYGRKYYDSKALAQVKAHYNNKPKPNANSKTSTKDDIIQQQQDHIADLKSQINTLNGQLAVKDKEIEAQIDQVKQISMLISQAHALTLQAQKGQNDKFPDKVQNDPQTAPEDAHGWLWKMFH